jgi:hypothetical protein
LGFVGEFSMGESGSVITRLLRNFMVSRGKRKFADIAAQPAGVAVIAAGPSASVDYLVAPYLGAIDSEVVYLNLEADSPLSISACGCHTVVIVRYLSQGWARELKKFKSRGGRIIYFMDDDLMDVDAFRTLPATYAEKIYRLATRWRSTIEAIASEFWVTSPYLANKYGAWSPRLLSPRPRVSQLLGKTSTTICYHGSSSHQTELKWLVPVMKKVQTADVDTSFEVFGDHSVYKMYRGLPRVSVLHPMSWDSYLHHTALSRKDIGLAPLMPEPFNAARGPTKFFDFVRMDAVGIYSDRPPYSDFVRNGVDGVLLPDDPDLWARTIIGLALDVSARSSMAVAARERALDMASD